MLFNPLSSLNSQEINQHDQVTKPVTIQKLPPLIGGKLSRGVGNVTIYIDSASGASYWQTYMQAAANNWMYTGWDNPIYIQFVSSNYGSTIDFYCANNNNWTNVPGTVLVETLLYDANENHITGRSSNWFYA